MTGYQHTTSPTLLSRHMLSSQVTMIVSSIPTSLWKQIVAGRPDMKRTWTDGQWQETDRPQNLNDQLARCRPTHSHSRASHSSMSMWKTTASSLASSAASSSSLSEVGLAASGGSSESSCAASAPVAVPTAGSVKSSNSIYVCYAVIRRRS